MCIRDSFYPCLTYNFDEGLGDNHYNCPVVAYYPEVLAGNCPELELSLIHISTARSCGWKRTTCRSKALRWSAPASRTAAVCWNSCVRAVSLML